VGRADPWLEFVRPLPSDSEGVKNYSGPRFVTEPYGGLGTMRSFVRDKQFSSGERFSLRPFGNY